MTKPKKALTLEERALKLGIPESEFTRTYFDLAGDSLKNIREAFTDFLEKTKNFEETCYVETPKDDDGHTLPMEFTVFREVFHSQAELEKLVLEWEENIKKLDLEDKAHTKERELKELARLKKKYEKKKIKC